MGRRRHSAAARPEIALTAGMREALIIRERQLPSDWIESCMILSRSYATQGRVKLIPWQREIADAILEYDEVTMIAPVQTGKSMLEEGLLGYCIDQEPRNVLMVYEKRETVEDVFDERLKPLITETPTLRRHWDGDPDNLTKRRIKLNHMVARVGSASNRSDIASHNAGMVFGDEVAKWAPRGKEKFDPLKLLQGRTHASRMLGRPVKYVFATSPRVDGDPSHKLAHRPGTRFCQPHYRCPHCGRWQVLSDSQIKEVPNRKGEHDHDPGRIRDERAARYECTGCAAEITESERVEISERVVWAAVDSKTGATIEQISDDGTVSRRVEASRAVYNWSRLVDVTWSFAECLASYFEALQSPDGATLADYQNEDMARWVRTTSRRFAESWLEKRARQSKYMQYGTEAYVPDAVMVLMCGIDTQDDGFYYVVRGFGANLESWLVRADFVKCEMDQGLFVNPGEVHQALMAEIQRWPYQKRDGTKLPIVAGFIDRGGHRSDDVDYICGHSPFLHPYVGSTRKDAPLIRRSDKGGHWMGNTEQLSRTVEKWMSSEIWHLPRDIHPQYCEQVLNQHEQEYVDTRGNSRRRWVTGNDTGQPDHYRDCENMIVGASVMMDLQGMLFSDVGRKVVENAVRGVVDHDPDLRQDQAEASRRPRGPKPEDERATFGGQTITDWLGQAGW